MNKSNIFGLAMVRVNREMGGPVVVEIEEMGVKPIVMRVGIGVKKKFEFSGGYMNLKPLDGSGNHMLTLVQIGGVSSCMVVCPDVFFTMSAFEFREVKAD